MNKKALDIIGMAIPVLSIVCAVAQTALDRKSRDEAIEKAVEEYMKKHQ